MDDYLTSYAIRPFLLHEYALVREDVAAYFHDACSRDERLIPFITRSCHRYGAKANVACLELATRFTLTRESVELVLDLLAQAHDELVIYILNGILAAMPAPVFRVCRCRLREAANVFPSTVNVLSQRQALADRDPGKVLSVLEHFIESSRGKECPDRIQRTYAANLIEALVPHIEGSARSGVPCATRLIERLVYSSGRGDWGALYVIDLLGKCRIKKAVPAIVECLTFDSQKFGEHASKALIRIGDVEAVRLLRARMPHENEDFRYQAAAVLAGFKHPEAEQALIDLLETEADAMFRFRYCRGLCKHYSLKGDDIVRRQIESSAALDAAVLKAGVLVTSVVRNLGLSDAERWHKELEEPRRELEGLRFGRVADVSVPPAARA